MIVENTVIEFIDSKIISRILYKDENFNTVYIINLNEERWPYPYDYIRLMDELKEEKIKVIEDTFTSLIGVSI